MENILGYSFGADPIWTRNPKSQTRPEPDPTTLRPDPTRTRENKFPDPKNRVGSGRVGSGPNVYHCLTCVCSK